MFGKWHDRDVAIEMTCQCNLEGPCQARRRQAWQTSTPNGKIFGLSQNAAGRLTFIFVVASSVSVHVQRLWHDEAVFLLLYRSRLH